MDIFETDDNNRLQLIQQITQGSYLFLNLNTQKTVVAFKTQHNWVYVCNLSQFLCADEEFIPFDIPNTEHIPWNPHNSLLFKKEFEHYFLKSYLDSFPLPDKTVFQLHTEFFGKTLPNFFLENNYSQLDATQRSEYKRTLRLLERAKELNTFEKFANSLNIMYVFIDKADFENEGARFLMNHKIPSDEDAPQNILHCLPSHSYLMEQLSFIQNLSQKDLDILNLYSHNGDIYLNKFIRNGYQMSNEIQEYKDSHARAFVKYESYHAGKITPQLFYDELMDLISRAPPVDKPFVVYRGSRTRDHFNGTSESVYIDRGFVSTSLDPNVALTEFSGQRYMSVIHVPIGAHCIFNIVSQHPYELEFIFPDKTYFLVTKEFQSCQYLLNFSSDEHPIDSVVNVSTNELIIMIDETKSRIQGSVF